MPSSEGSLFKNLLKRGYHDQDGRPIPSGGVEHASETLRFFFKRAQKSIKIVTSTLEPRVYGTPRVVSEARQFAGNISRDLQIIFLRDYKEILSVNHPLIDGLLFNQNLHLYQSPHEDLQKIDAHFWLMDDNAYRFRMNGMGNASVVAFNDKEYFEHLMTHYNRILKQCIPLNNHSRAA